MTIRGSQFGPPYTPNLTPTERDPLVTICDSAFSGQIVTESVGAVPVV